MSNSTHKDELEKQIKDLKDQVELTAKDYFNKAYDYAENEQYQLAIDNYTSALKINPDYAKAYYNRGNAYVELKNYTAAIADYTSALKINPFNVID